MGILSVYSTNPKLSWILQKNPETIRENKKPYQKSLRKGIVSGWFKQNDQEFVLWFKDHPTEISFPLESSGGDFEYLDQTRYSNPYLAVMMISENLATASRDLDPLDTPEYRTTVKTLINHRHTDRLLNDIKTFDNEVDIQVKPIGGYNHELSVTCNTVYRALNVMRILCFNTALYNPEIYISLKQHEMLKYAKMFNAAQIPYVLRYRISQAMYTEPHTFTKHKSFLEGPGMVMNYGNTQKQRFYAIKDVLKKAPRSNVLIDIGCGELFNSFALSGRYVSIYAFDKDQEEFEASEGRIKRRQVQNIDLFNVEVDKSYVEASDDLFEGAHVLMSEVIEHMPFDKAVETVTSILKTDFNTMIVTTPNSEFNRYYGIEEGEFRHEDHRWELNVETLEEQFVRPILDDLASQGVTNVTYEITPVGDSIDGISTSTMVVFRNINYEVDNEESESHDEVKDSSSPVQDTKKD